MGKISENKVEEIKEAHDIVDIIGNYIEVKSSGSSYKALCPFHNEKTPSFMINKEKQIYKCFGCGEGGDVLQFVMKMENLDFIDSLKMLGEKANINVELEDDISDHERQETKLLYDINRKAGLFYYRKLTSSQNKGLQYLKNRGVGSNEIKAFGLGLAEDRWNSLLEYLTKDNYSEETIEKTGLILKNKKGDRYYDRFRNRIIFPIFNTRGMVIGFGGRVLDQSLPKYLNSPETKIFNKRKTLYGLNLAKKNIVSQQLILVEGYMDVIALYGNGVKNAVATLGTSLTKEHGQLLKKYAKEVVLAFDGDEAGVKATLRSIQILENEGLKIRILSLGKKEDPDDFIRRQGKDTFYRRIKESPNHIEYQIQKIRDNYSLESTEGKVDFSKEAIKLLQQVKSPIEQEAYAEEVAKELNLSKESLLKEIREKNQKYTNKPSKDQGTSLGSKDRSRTNYLHTMPDIEQDGHIKLEKLIIKFMMDNEDRIPFIKEHVDIEDFSIEKHQKIVGYLFYENQRSTRDHELQEHKELLDEISSLDRQEGEIQKILEDYLYNLKKYKLIYRKKSLEKKQQELIESPNFEKEEVDRILLKIGMEIMEINKELQNHQSKEGRGQDE
ncbi:DNA primase [Isachenkonia alkalipeptolytica]|uniref:DNA primase n=1 Tax=Isachenkonia alkalipeptolytica TaxID=2565777 RepID=A0AA44BFF7_9CLOT|nr:DNA primase [Isachenkonia alkalipeptolytica]NBG88496.1 DNA primase [Isachenkonia alkalipeptolytica]